MRVIDLTHTITESMPVFPGTQPPVLSPVHSWETSGFRETLINLCSHVGTHVDSPAHLFPSGKTLDAISPEQFIGKALVIDCRSIPVGGDIPLSLVQEQGKNAAQADFLLFNLGWSSKWGAPAYYSGYPCMSYELIEFVISGGYKGIGFDSMSVDPIDSSELSRHRKLLGSRDILIIENLTNLELCGSELFNFCCFPIKFVNSDGAPVRAAAWFE